jgi:hypothetical protein
LTPPEEIALDATTNGTFCYRMSIPSGLGLRKRDGEEESDGIWGFKFLALSLWPKSTSAFIIYWGTTR